MFIIMVASTWYFHPVLETKQDHDTFFDIDSDECSTDIEPGVEIDLHIAAKLVILEDNEAVLKMIIKGRSPNMRHVGRTHRVDLDWLFERISRDDHIFML